MSRPVITHFLAQAALSALVEPAAFVLLLAVSFAGGDPWIFRAILLALLGWKLTRFWTQRVAPLEAFLTGMTAAASSPGMFATTERPGAVQSADEGGSGDAQVADGGPNDFRETALSSPLANQTPFNPEMLATMRQFGLEEAEARQAVQMAQNIMPAMMNAVVQTLHQQFAGGGSFHGTPSGPASSYQSERLPKPPAPRPVLVIEEAAD